MKTECSTFHRGLEGHSEVGFPGSHPWPVWLTRYPTAQDGFTFSPFLAGSCQNGNLHKSGLALELLAMNCSYHHYQEISTKKLLLPYKRDRSGHAWKPWVLFLSSTNSMCIKRKFLENKQWFPICADKTSYNYCVPFHSLQLRSLCPYLSSCSPKFDSSTRWGLPRSSPFV